MILYRIRGRQEQFPDTGMVAADHIVDSSEIRMSKKLKRMKEILTKKNLRFDYVLEKVTILPLKLEVIKEVLETEDTENLIQSFKAINRIKSAEK